MTDKKVKKTPNCKECIYCKVRLPVSKIGELEFHKAQSAYCSKGYFKPIARTKLASDPQFRSLANKCESYTVDLDGDCIRLLPTLPIKNRIFGEFSDREE